MNSSTDIFSDSVAVYPIIPADNYTTITEPWFKVLIEQKRSLTQAIGKRAPFISVFGSALISPDSAIWQSGFKSGALLAQEGIVVMNGGYGGLMEASSS
ncbi:MAG: hypothetical protein ACK4OO_05760, partial [bacterium]